MLVSIIYPTHYFYYFIKHKLLINIIEISIPIFRIYIHTAATEKYDVPTTQYYTHTNIYRSSDQSFCLCDEKRLSKILRINFDSSHL